MHAPLLLFTWMFEFIAVIRVSRLVTRLEHKRSQKSMVSLGFTRAIKVWLILLLPVIIAENDDAHKELLDDPAIDVVYNPVRPDHACPDCTIHLPVFKRP